MLIVLLSLVISSAFARDLDGDGYRDKEDCEPKNPRVYPGVVYNETTGLYYSSIERAVGLVQEFAGGHEVIRICGKFTDIYVHTDEYVELIGYGSKTVLSGKASTTLFSAKNGHIVLRRMVIVSNGGPVVTAKHSGFDMDHVQVLGNSTNTHRYAAFYVDTLSDITFEHCEIATPYSSALIELHEHSRLQSFDSTFRNLDDANTAPYIVLREDSSAFMSKQAISALPQDAKEIDAGGTSYDFDGMMNGLCDANHGTCMNSVLVRDNR